MFELFTDRARKVVSYSKEAAYARSLEYVDTEHILAALLREPNGVGHHVLEGLGVSIGKIHVEVEKLVQAGDPTVEVDRGNITYSPRSNLVWRYAAEEAKLLGHKYVGTEHILLGLLRLATCNAAQVLTNLGVDIKDTRNAVLELLGHSDTKYTFEKVYSNDGDLYNVIKVPVSGDKEHVAFYDHKNKKLSLPKAISVDELGKIINACRDYE